MNEFVKALKADLLERRTLVLLGVLGVLLAAAVGYALTAGSGKATHFAATPIPAPETVPGPVVTEAPTEPATRPVSETTQGAGQHHGKARDPFAPVPALTPHVPSGTPGQSSGASAGSGGNASTPGGGGKVSAPGGGGNAPAPGSGTTTPAAPTQPQPSTPPAPSKPAHKGLTPTQSYRVGLSLTTLMGDLNTIHSLERLSVLPSEQQPLLVYLGVLNGGRRALFVVQPGTAVSGPGSCIPGPTDCEILSLAAGQIESIGVDGSGGTSNVAMFAVTTIKAQEHSSGAMAMHVRWEASAAGQALLSRSNLSVLPLFEYEPRQGVVVDLRNLEAGEGK